MGVSAGSSVGDLRMAMPGQPHAGPSVIDLFCGAGGLSQGLAHAGFRIALGTDWDKHALASFTANHEAPGLQGDIRELSGSDLLTEASLSHVDVIAGGPSCQGFSTHGKRLEDDERNFLYREFMRVVHDVRPPVVIMENVKGLLISGRGAYKAQVEQSFQEMGYHVTSGVLLAADYGVPQLRERVIFLASLLGPDIELPRPTHGPAGSLRVHSGELQPYRTVHDAISDLPLIGDNHKVEPSPYAREPENSYQRRLRGTSTRIWNHTSRPLSELAHSIVTKVGQGQGLRSLPVEDMPPRFHKMRRIANGELRRDCTTLYHRLAEDRPSYTITCYFTNVSAGAFTHPTEDRAITAREAARLQSFSDDFRFVGASIPRQIGNAVPPLLAEVVGEAVAEHLQRHGLAVAS